MNANHPNDRQERQPSRMILWFDDDPDVFERTSHHIRRQGNRCELEVVGSFGEFEDRAIVYAEHAHDLPMIVFVVAREIPDARRLRETLERVPIRGVISDLEMGGDSLAGLTILSAAALSQSHPKLALYSASEDPSVQRLAMSIGVNTFISKRDDDALSRLLDEWLDLRDYESSRRFRYLAAEVEKLRRQTRKLQREKRVLKKELETTGSKKRSLAKGKEDLKSEGAAKEQIEKVQQLTQMVLSHNHDLSNTSSLTLKTLEHLCGDTNLVPPVLLADLQRARIAAKHCDILVQSLASISGNEKRLRSELSSVVNAITDAREIVQRKVPKDIFIETEISKSLPLCSVPTHLLVRMLLNLLLNAIEAMPRGGRIWITARPSRAKEKSICLQVRDSGIGIKKSELPKACRYDFSTKGKRHGFGLFICQRIVADFKGKMTLRSTRGKGTTVFLEIPSA